MTLMLTPYVFTEAVGHCFFSLIQCLRLIGSCYFWLCVCPRLLYYLAVMTMRFGHKKKNQSENQEQEVFSPGQCWRRTEAWWKIEVLQKHGDIYTIHIKETCNMLPGLSFIKIEMQSIVVLSTVIVILHPSSSTIH